MGVEHWKRIDELLDAALDLPRHERATFLERACGDDEELRREVEALLSADRRAGDFLESPAVDATTTGAGQFSLSAGARIAHYDILSRLRMGGMSEIYLAEDTRLRRRVALKLLPLSLLHDERRIARFEQEARAAAKLAHPNICVVYEVGLTETGRHFIAMEYVEGETLRERLTRGAMPVQEALAVARQVLHALEAAHEAGIVHRDIKPENIILRADGYTKVLDFGLAKLTARNDTHVAASREPTAKHLTHEGAVLGTVSYMSPEQARGESVDRRSDIFAFGSVLYEMLTGELAFRRRSAVETMNAIIHDDPPRLPVLHRQVPAAIARVVARCLKKRPEERFQSAHDLALTLTLASESQQDGRAGAALLDVSRALGRVRRRARSITLAAVGLSLALVAGVYFGSRAPSITSIAILPFLNQTGDQEADYLGDGIAEALTNTLSRLPNLRVLSHGSARRYRGPDVDPLVAGRDLGVEAVLVGRVRRSGDDLSIGVELIDVRDNSHVWGASFDGRFADLVTIQREMAQSLSEQLRLQLTGAQALQLATEYTNDPSAYDYYLKGRYVAEKLVDEKAQRQAIGYYEQALARDPDFAAAYSGLADAYLFVIDHAALQSVEVEKARQAARTALEKDASLGEAHITQANILWLFDWDYPGAEREFRKGLALSPGYAQGHHHFAHFLLAANRTDEALAEALRFLELDPVSWAANRHLAQHYLLTRDFDRAIAQYSRTIAIGSTIGLDHEELGDAYYFSGRHDEAVEEWTKAMQASGRGVEAISAYRAAYAARGVRGYVERLLEDQLATPDRGERAPFHMAKLYAALGDAERAVQWLERAYANRSLYLTYTIEHDPWLDALRGDPRFVEIERKMGLRP